MPEFEFRLVLSRPLNDDDRDALFQYSVLEHMLVGTEKGVGVIDVDWKETSYDAAVSAVKKVLSNVIPDIEVTSVVPLTPLE